MNISFNGIQEIAKKLYQPTSQPKDHNGIAYIPGQVGNWKVFFNEENKQAFKNTFNHLLIQFGYETGSNW